MKKCKHEDYIDEYLFNRLNESEKKTFEEHYFNCSHCFEKMAEKDELIAVIKAKGSKLFKEVYTSEQSKQASWLESVYAFLTPSQWAMAAISAALILIIALGIIPNFKTKTPEFFINEDLVRGSSISLISPLIDNLNTVPSEFRWQSLGENIDYKLSIYHEEELLWSTTTKDNFITLPEEVKNLMEAGKKYSWQVKAFSSEGTLVAVSSRVQFKFYSNK